MEIKVKHTVLKKRHPKEFADIIESIRKGNSKCKDAKPDELTWGYAWNYGCWATDPDEASRFSLKIQVKKDKWCIHRRLDKYCPPEIIEFYQNSMDGEDDDFKSRVKMVLAELKPLVFVEGK